MRKKRHNKYAERERERERTHAIVATETQEDSIGTKRQKKDMVFTDSKTQRRHRCHRNRHKQDIVVTETDMRKTSLPHKQT